MSNKIFTVKACSNIALIKYWGKKDVEHQWPYNDSISMSLSDAITTTECSLIDTNKEDIVVFDEKILDKNTEFCQKIIKHINFLKSFLKYEGFLCIKTHNSFAHSCGIASSASGFCALTLAVVAAITDSSSLDELKQKGFDIQKLSSLSRMGSGSSCRSFYGGFVKWHASEHWSTQKISQLFDEKHWDLCDVIVIISDKSKKKPSSLGHTHADKSPLFQKRILHLNNRIAELEKSIAAKDIKTFSYIVEIEAKEFYDIIDTSIGAYNYFIPQTHEFIKWFFDIKDRYNIEMCYTWDAGANVHVIAESCNLEKIVNLIKTNFNQYPLIINKVGSSPILQVREER